MSLQEDFLNAFFPETRAFFLTGGNALNLYYFKHRISEDLDCFTTDSVEFGRVQGLIAKTCGTIGATCVAKQDFTDFKRFLISRNAEQIVVDCVYERVRQLYPEKRMIGKIRVDVPEEMVANKLCALLGRTEYKDLVDLFVLQKNGFGAVENLPAAAKKDGGLTAVSLAYALENMDLSKMPDSLKSVVPMAELERFRTDLRDHLLRAGFPGDPAIR